ncbi:hypothetical protein BUALT_Bualt16G0057400 [Buddleja alternifolia]|uniref:PABC domain-containing protein n=1 Tax=Buddleja alternifolia TaxID=168488 RepID=A0AAV6WHQ7_9LAMI|nr:hypothetical protein BUALT_Bualt16G0057400 [Buddleja alternifolia]
MLQEVPGRLYHHPPTGTRPNILRPNYVGTTYDANDFVRMLLDPNDMIGRHLFPYQSVCQWPIIPLSIVESILPVLEPNKQLALLALVTLEGQCTVLGENLYPLVEELNCYENAPKITGMLLELPHVEILHLLRLPNALRTRVAEALDVLRRAHQPNK